MGGSESWIATWWMCLFCLSRCKKATKSHVISVLCSVNLFYHIFLPFSLWKMNWTPKRYDTYYINPVSTEHHSNQQSFKGFCLQFRDTGSWTFARIGPKLMPCATVPGSGMAYLNSTFAPQLQLTTVPMDSILTRNCEILQDASYTHVILGVLRMKYKFG